ncbi:MAG TPA: S49 family peptidase [Geminicoccaceae bacterium]|nr:S49 family peptidase [Geminicoccaceae bacterium]
MRRIVVGVLATIGAVALLLAAGGFAAAWLLLGETPQLPGQMILTLDLREEVPEMHGGEPLGALGLPQSPTLIEVTMALEAAGRDSRVKGLLARLDGEGPGLAQAQELRSALAAFRDRGKFAYAHADSFGEFGPGTVGYYLATAFDEIHLQPLGGLGLTGILIETPLLRGLLDNLGIDPAGGKRGAYKHGADIFTDSTLSPEHRESLESLADSLDAQIKSGIAEGRGMAVADVARLVDRGPYVAEEGQMAGLVDGLSYWREVTEQARDRAGAGSQLVSLEDYIGAIEAPPDDAPVVGLVRGVGQIQRGNSDHGPTGGWIMGADTVAHALADAIDDPEVAAILFRIDSGGGSAVASETIGREVRRAVEQGKPVIVSMGTAAASGGYWIAMDASQIVADPGTLTGSIGVFAGKPVLTEFWGEIGVNWGQVARGANATMWSTLQDYDRRGRARLDAFLDQVYAAFTDGVARGRGLSRDQVLEIAQGRVWTGQQAKEIGLVDELGGFTRALAVTREAIGVAPDRAVELRAFPPPLDLWDQALELLGAPPGWIDAVGPWLQLLRPGMLSAPPIVVR